MGVHGATLLTSAVCEWFLIFLLFFESALSYFLARFARYCHLQFPCLLCTRLDRFFGKDKQEFYQNLFCGDHRSELASLASYHAHGKIADGKRMCDDCLLSCTTSTKPNMKSHKLLVGKLGMVNGGSSSQSPSLSKDSLNGAKGPSTCAGCYKLCKSEQNALRSIQLKSPKRTFIKPPYIPLPQVPRQSRSNHRDNSKKTKGQSSGSEDKRSHRQPSRMVYNEPKMYSDSESDFPFSDDDVASVLPGNTSRFKPVVPPRHVLRGLNLPNPNISSPKAMPSRPDSSEEPKISKHHDVPEEINLKPENQSSSELPELISLDDVPSSPNAEKIPRRESDGVKTTSPSQNSLPTSISELMTLDGIGASLNKPEDVTKSSGVELATEEDRKDTKKIDTTQKASVETDKVVSDSSPLSHSQENSNNMSQSPVSTKENVTAGGSDNSEVLANHVQSTERHVEASDSNEVKPPSSSSSVGSDFEYLDGSKVNEIEGESIIDQLKRQIEYDKKCLEALQKELEEERNASAIATNQTMNMITRLQEEKAALQMEALQYLRMMEEQAEYDRDELDKVNDLLTEKEKELQDLEAELEFYRENWPEEPMVQISNLKVENVAEQKTATDITNAVTTSGSKLTKVSKIRDEDPIGATSSPLDFEEEKQCILNRLKSLQNRLKELYGNEVSSEKIEGKKLDQQGSSNGEEEIDSSMQKNVNNMSNGNHTDKDGSASLDSDDCSHSNGNNHSRKEVELDALENEISDLSERLEAIEFNHNLLEHIFNSLRSGDDGKQFIQDLAIQLRDIRKIGIRSR
ncbi:hypothetical protein HN51_046929, partial [Arachis hypogaea]|uniref:myosin-binding protein 3-like n=1 Tax=Arachis ipaensis TaxID=130454 RepID=UPI0007AFC16E|nr:myosin-binding protein 3-like [Arachis ipaensis]XP_025632350.1 myosin-binding protein 3 [Arachis hypogaea]